MNNASQETTTETKAPSITDDNISQADYEALRSGKTVEVEKSAPAVKKASETDDESDTSKLEATDSDSDEESEIEESDDEATELKPKKKSGTQRRIEKLVKQRSEAERERDLLRREYELLKSKQPDAEGDSQTESVAAKAAATEGEPDPDDFDTSTEFYRAHARWAAQQEIKAAKESDRQEKLRTEAESKKTTFYGKVEDFKKAHDDFADVISDVDDIMMSPAISQVILESDNGPELMYELAKNRDEYAHMCSLSPFEAVRAFGRFEAKFLNKSSEQKPETKTKTTKAPPPPKPISTSSANGKKSIMDDNISQADYERLRNEQEKRRASNY